MSQLFVDNIKNRTGGAVGFPTGVVVTGVATFNNQVSLAGTLTYKDVTNVDSTGIVTAKSGIKVTGGEIIVGSGFSVGQAGIVTASGIRVGTAITIDATSGIITATSFSGGTSGDFSIEDKLVHTGDTNTAIRFPAADTFSVETGGSERLRVDSGGRLLVTSGNTTLNVSGFNPNLQVAGTSADSSSLMTGRFGNNASAPLFIFHKSRNASINGNTIVADDDILGRIAFYGADGSDYEEAAHIQAEVDGTPGAGTDMPGRLVFATTADGDHNATERLRITSAGNVSIQNDSGKFTAGAGDDLEIYHDGSNSRIVDTGTGQLILQTNALRILNAAGSENMIDGDENGAVTLYHNSSAKLATTSDGVTLTGRLSPAANDTYGLGQASLRWANLFLSGNLDMSDNDKIVLGTGDDLEIYHNGSHSFIADTSGTGNLYLNSNKVVITNAADTETLANFIENGAVELFYDASKKLETSSSGVTVTGTLNATTAITQNGASLATAGKAVAMALVFG